MPAVLVCCAFNPREFITGYRHANKQFKYLNECETGDIFSEIILKGKSADLRYINAGISNDECCENACILQEGMLLMLLPGHEQEKRMERLTWRPASTIT